MASADAGGDKNDALLYVPLVSAATSDRAQSAAEQHGDDGAVAQAFQRRDVPRVQQRLGVFLRKPFPIRTPMDLALFTR